MGMPPPPGKFFLFTCLFTEVSQSSVKFTNSPVHSDCQPRPDHTHKLSSTCHAPCLPRHYPPLPPIPLTLGPPRVYLPKNHYNPSGSRGLQETGSAGGVNRYELRHMRTVQTVIEQRIVSSEVIKNNRVVTSRVWPVRSTLHIPLYM